ncbi:MAG: aminotransferase class IV [Gemmatimonadota bacterium]
MIVYSNGRYLPAADAVISIEDRGFLYGEGVFETALLHDGGFFRLREHLQRLAASATMLRIPAPPLDDIVQIVRSVAQKNQLVDASLRITLSRGPDGPALLVTARPLDSDWSRRAAAGWRIITARTRRPSTAAMPAQLKALGRTYALLARFEAADAGADDALLLTDAGDVCEGPTWNVFWRTADTLFTPALEAGVLAGVTRRAVLELAATAGLQVREGLFPRAALDSADEMFATMTSVGLVTIRALDGRGLHADDAAQAIQPLYRRLVAADSATDPV